MDGDEIEIRQAVLIQLRNISLDKPTVRQAAPLRERAGHRDMVFAQVNAEELRIRIGPSQDIERSAHAATNFAIAIRAVRLGPGYTVDRADKVKMRWGLVMKKRGWILDLQSLG